MNLRISNSLKESEYTKGFFLILSSKIVIAALTFISTPIIARIYSPQDYGIYAILNSILINLVLFTNLSLPSAVIVLKKSKLNASISGIIGYSFYSNLVFLVTGTLLLLFNDTFKTKLASIVGFDFTIGHLLVITFFSILVTVSEVFANLNIKEKKFKRNVVVNLTDTISNKASSIVIGLFIHHKLGLFIAELVGKFNNIFYQLYKVNFKISFLKIKNFKKLRTIQNTVRDNHLYPKFNLPTTFLNKFSGQLVIWIFAIYFSVEQIGYFTMAISMVGIPLLLLANSLNPLITKKLSEEREQGFKGNTLFKLFSLITLLSLFVYSLLFFFSPYFVNFYLGEKWIESITYIKILCVPFSLMLISNAIGGAFLIYEKQKNNLFFKLFSFISLIVGITLIMNSTMSFIQLVWLYATIISLEQLLNTIYILRKAKHV
ncbi:oligosaccharide flippase family protein [Marivirga sp. S37H4]|uniref:Oligosaccharide flippase family protein n=1 Tax=Marivirga aurantiaca TaxID=2802615 RepID=A0A935CBC2_9BACT|nr:oligosaccharide flippase family protein [Marivirga aurantiaca]MBK6267009.1 oligosaccharide flippase family protein [Marivirga aurantiaca]